MRILVYSDDIYRRRDGTVHAQYAVALFVVALADELGELTLLGRLADDGGPARYPLSESTRFVALPHYARLSDPLAVLRSVPQTARRMWRALDDADLVWSLGPFPHAIVMALLARVRRRRLVLGLRQDFPAYVRNRHSGRRGLLLWLAAEALERCWRLLARHTPVVAVGADLARRYQHAPRVLAATISLIDDADIRAGELAARGRDYDSGELRLLSVGRLDGEKNPLLLADAFALLHARDPRWRLVVCGEGTLADALAERLDALGLGPPRSEIRGYVPLHGGLLDLYRSSHAFLHSSFTEGLPQVLVEALASGLPAVATDVGGVGELADSLLLVPPADAAAAAAAVERIVTDRELRERLVRNGLERAAGLTLERQVSAVAHFILAHPDGR